MYELSVLDASKLGVECAITSTSVHAMEDTLWDKRSFQQRLLDCQMSMM